MHSLAGAEEAGAFVHSEECWVGQSIRWELAAEILS